MRVAVHRIGADPDHLEQLGDPALLFGAARELVNLDSLADDRAHLHPRVERRVRVLEDELHLAPERTQLGASERL